MQFAKPHITPHPIRFEPGGEHIGSGDLELFQHIRSAFRDNARDYQHVGWLIRDGIALSQSIDDFLDLHRANSKVNLYGKAAIVKSILESERNSRLYFETTGGVEKFDASRVSDAWLVKFIHMLGRGIPKETAPGDIRPCLIYNFQLRPMCRIFSPPLVTEIIWNSRGGSLLFG